MTYIMQPTFTSVSSPKSCCLYLAYTLVSWARPRSRPNNTNMQLIDFTAGSGCRQNSKTWFSVLLNVDAAKMPRWCQIMRPYLSKSILYSPHIRVGGNMRPAFLITSRMSKVKRTLIVASLMWCPRQTLQRFESNGWPSRFVLYIMLLGLGVKVH